MREWFWAIFSTRSSNPSIKEITPVALTTLILDIDSTSSLAVFDICSSPVEFFPQSTRLSFEERGFYFDREYERKHKLDRS